MVTSASIHLTAVTRQGVNDLHRTEAMSAVRLTAVLTTQLPLRARFIKKDILFVTHTNPSHLPSLYLKYEQQSKCDTASTSQS